MTKFSYMGYNLALSTILGGYNRGTFFIYSGFLSKVKGSFLFNVKKGLFGSFSCYKVRVLSKVVTDGNRSTDFPTILATQYDILIRRSYKIRFCNSVKS